MPASTPLIHVAKTLCDWSKKDILNDFEELSRLTECPRYVCKKCARSAECSKFLCKPKKREAIYATSSRESWQLS